MTKGPAIGTVAVLALTGGIAYRAFQASSASPPIPSVGLPQLVASTNPSSTSQESDRSEGPCQVIRDFLDHKEETVRDTAVSGRLTVNGGKSGTVDLSYSGTQQTSHGDNDCGEGRLAYMIALVADPVNSHLALTFDRTVESLMRGASTAGYSYVNYYFPWETALAKNQSDVEKRKQQRDEKRRVEKWPGLLLFRAKDGEDIVESGDRCGCRYQQLPLAIFLVAETPTAGINRFEFQRAGSYITEGNRWPCPVPIVGPTFSGSAQSLVQAIETRGSPRFRIYNGSATSKDARTNIAEALPELDGAAGFASFLHTDSSSFTALWNRLALKSGALGPIAILSEDATGYGRQKLNNIRSITYPREVSRLRNATAPASLADPQAAPQAIGQLLPLDLRDESSGHDSVRTYAAQTASSQEAAILSIGRELQDGHYSYVGILASDPLDGIFLSRAVRDLRPDARLFFLDNDLLYVRAAADSPLDGTLSLTTYPLFLANQTWTADGSAIPFPNQISEAQYNATVAILSSFHNGPAHDPHDQLLEYFPPHLSNFDNQSSKEPPLWITVLTRSGYWPVAMVTDPPAQEPDMYLWNYRHAGAGIHFGRPDHVWTAAFLILSLLAALYSVFVIGTHSMNPNDVMRWQESFWVIPNERDLAGRAAYLTAKTFAILTTYCILTAPLLKLYWGGGPLYIAAIVVALVVVAALLTAVLFPGKVLWNSFVDLPAGDRKLLHENHHVYLAMVAAVFGLACIGTWAAAVFPAGPRLEALFLAWRSVNLLSGVSPVLPLLFLAAGVLWWAWMHFRRLILLSGRTPQIPNISQAQPEFDFGILSGNIDRAVGDPFFRWKWRVVTASVIFLAIAIDPAKLLLTIESDPYDLLYRGTLALLAALIFLTFTRMLVVWERLKLFLEQLERHPLRSAFSEMPKDRVWSPIIQKGAMRRSYLFEMRALETARVLRSLDPNNAFGAGAQTMEQDLGPKLDKVARGLRISFEQAADSYDAIRSLAESAAGGYLAAEWDLGSSESLAGRQEKIEEKATDRPPDLTAAEKLKRVAAEFVALPYLFYIRVNLLQIHNLLFFVAGGFVLLVFSVGSYPFQAPRALGWVITASLLFLGFGVARTFAQMSRDSVLSRITDTEPGKLDSDFYLKLISAGALPVISVILAQFPSVGRFLFSWLQPTLQAIK